MAARTGERRSSRSRTGAAIGITVALGLGMVPALAGTASAHPEVKHGPSAGHLPAVQDDVRLVGEARVTPRPGTTAFPAGTDSPLEGKVADVNVFGNFAYLASFREPTCDNGGVFVVDVTNPAKPVELPGSFIPSAPGTYVGEGVQVLEIGARDVLLFNQEPCDATVTPGGGFSLVDVTDPRNPVPLAISAGDVSGDGTNDAAVTTPHSAHSVFGWNDGAKSYLVAVDNIEERDIDLFDISNPAAPVLVSETSFADDPRVVQADPPNGDSQFLHDLVVKEINGRQTMLASYWDNGYLILDVENPAAPTFLRDTDFAATEPFAAELNLPEGTEPEGNAHQAEFSPDNQFFIDTDEDFNPFRIIARITSGPNTGAQFTASQGSGTPNVDEDTTISGPTRFLGDGCDASTVPTGSATQTAVIERGTCTFQVKYDNAVAKGFGAVIVFNNVRSDCQGLVNSSVVGTTVPFREPGRRPEDPRPGRRRDPVHAGVACGRQSELQHRHPLRVRRLGLRPPLRRPHHAADRRVRHPGVPRRRQGRGLR